MIYNRPSIFKGFLTIIIVLLLFWGFYTLQNFAFGLYHTLVEFFSVLITWTIAIIMINLNRIEINRFYRFFGISFCIIGTIDLLHMLSYSGLALIPGYDNNLPTSLWIVARYLQSFSFLIAPLIIKYPDNNRLKIFIYTYYIMGILLIFSVFIRWFPVCFIEGIGLTPFKKISEYIIIFLFGVSLLGFYSIRQKLDMWVIRYFMIAIVLSMISEFLFTLYSTPYDFVNGLGHYLKIIVFFLISKALISKSIHDPIDMLYLTLKNQEIRYRTLFENMSEGFALHEIICNDEGIPINYVFLDVNTAYEHFTGLKRTEIVNKKALDIFPNLERFWIERYGKVALTGKPAQFESFSQTLGKFYHVIVYSPVKNHFASLLLDITEQKKVEASLRSLNENLARSNKDLESFAYVVAHDLQEPLRSISMFSQLILKNVPVDFDSKTNDYFHTIINNVKRLQTLILDLLQYSQLITTYKNREPVSLNDILKEVLSNLTNAINTSGAEIISDPLPIMICNKSHFIELFQNLLSNSIKFHNIHPPKIHIGVYDEKDYWRFTVEDNGIGIEQEMIKELFILFRRLHSQNKYQGNGLGLAMCKRIIDRYQGKIWIESEIDKGTKVLFTLPKNITPSNQKMN